MLIVQIGINDASYRMTDDYREDFAHAIKPFYIPKKRYWENSLLITILLKMFTSPRNEWFPNKNYYLEEAFLKDSILDHARKNGVFEEHTPGNIQKNTSASFQRNLKIFKAVSNDFGVKIVFITTPFNYKGRGRDIATEEHNALIKKFSSKENIPLVSLDTQIKWNKELFVDDMHLNEKGQVIKAKIVADYILNNGIILND